MCTLCVLHICSVYMYCIYVFESLFCSPRLRLFKTVKTIFAIYLVYLCTILMIYNVIYSCDDSWIVSSLQSSVSRDSSEIMIDADLVLKKHLLLLSVLKKLCCLIFFVWKTRYLLWVLEYKVKRKLHLFDIEIFCNINVFNVNID